MGARDLAEAGHPATRAREGVLIGGAVYRRPGDRQRVFEMKVGRAGAVVPTTFVEYTRGRRTYTLVMGWEMGRCGTEAVRVLEQHTC